MRAFVCSALLLLAGCDAGRPSLASSEGAPSETLEVHFQSQFLGDAVSVEIDGIRVFSDRVRTDDVLSLATTVPLPVAPGQRGLRVTVGGRGAALFVEVPDVEVVAVRYDRQRERIDLIPLAERPLYD